MSVSYTCPNPDCNATLRTANRVATGKVVKCPKCSRTFVPEPEEPASAAPAGGTFKFADPDPPKKAAAPKPPPPPPAPAAKSRYDDEDDEDAESIKRGYGVVKEMEAELKEAEKNKVKFGEVTDKFRKSARGPAIGMMVMPANLLTAEGLITAVGGIVLFMVGMWPLVFTDAPPSDDEVGDAIVTMLLGMMVFGWGVLVCYGASQMHEIASYPWAMAGAVMGIFPLLIGIYAVTMLQNPKVKAGFQEVEGALDEDEDEPGTDDEDEDDEDDDDDD